VVVVVVVVVWKRLWMPECGTRAVQKRRSWQRLVIHACHCIKSRQVLVTFNFTCRGKGEKVPAFTPPLQVIHS